MQETQKKSKEIRDNQLLKDYIAEFSEDVKLTTFNLKEKSLMSSSIWAKWLAYLFHEKENLARIAKLKQQIIQKKSSENSMTDSVLRLKSQEKLAESDENIKKLNILNKKTQDCIDYLERALTILANFGFQIKNTTDIMKLQNS